MNSPLICSARSATGAAERRSRYVAVIDRRGERDRLTAQLERPGFALGRDVSADEGLGRRTVTLTLGSAVTSCRPNPWPCC